MRTSIRRFAGVLVVGGAVFLANDAQAMCLDPLGCFTDLCAYPGNVLEVTATTDSADNGLVTVRVDAVHVVDATRFTLPTVGDMVEIYPGLHDIASGETLIAVTREARNSGWTLYALDTSGMVTCLDPSNDVALTVAEVQSVIIAGECSGGPLPEALTRCDDTGDDGCGGGGVSSLWPLALVAVARVRRRKSAGYR